MDKYNTVRRHSTVGMLCPVDYDPPTRRHAPKRPPIGRPHDGPTVPTKALAPFIEHGRTVRAGDSRQRRRRGAASTSRAADTKAIREWARQQGLQVSERGRIPAEIVERYEREALTRVLCLVGRSDWLGRGLQMLVEEVSHAELLLLPRRMSRINEHDRNTPHCHITVSRSALGRHRILAW